MTSGILSGTDSKANTPSPNMTSWESGVYKKQTRAKKEGFRKFSVTFAFSWGVPWKSIKISLQLVFESSPQTELLLALTQDGCAAATVTETTRKMFLLCLYKESFFPLL